MSANRIITGLGLLALLSCAHVGIAQISKGHQILIDRGFQVQGMVNVGDPFHLTTYSNANYTAINWLWDSNPSAMGAAPGFPWTRWVRTNSVTEMPPLGSEAGYMSQLVALQLGDEWNLNDAAWRDALVNWFNAVRSSFPNTILYHNSYGGQVGDAELGDFIVRAQPDMISYDTYPFWYDGSHTSPGDTPIHWYGDLRRYREHARQNNIPLACYMQTYHSTTEGVRDPSPSELRLLHFAALAFNAKVLIDFTYNTGASSLFNPAFGGDNSPNALYTEKADCALRARNFGKALVRLKPIADASYPDLRTTSMMFIRGKDPGGNFNPIPIGFVAPGSYTDWAYQRNDPYLTNNWAVTNLGTKNNGQPGDVIVSWFKPLDESFDGAATNEVYVMVVNALCATNGTAADCLQEIKLNFLDAFSSLDMLDPVSGQLTNVTLPVVNTRRQLTLMLNGGDAALFKFADGAQFVGFPPPTNAPAITSQPVNQTNLVGTAATFNVTATGYSPLSYRWRFSGTNIAGATTNSYTRSNVQTNDAGNYTVVVSNAFGSMTSTVATLTVLVPPQITTQPQSRIVLAGSNVLFTVVATGTPPLSYQWRFNTTNIAGATASSYTRTNAQLADAGSYSIVVSNVAGLLVSSNAILTVNSPPFITTQPQNQAVLAGGSASFSVGVVGTEPLTYRWRWNGSALSDGGNVSGATNANLNLSSAQADDLGNYTVTVSNAYGGIVSAPATLSFATQPVILVQPQSQTNIFGATISFEVVADGGGLIYQWRRSGTNIADGGNISGAATDLLVLSSATKFDTTSYTVLITNVAGSVTSSPATLSLIYQPPFREPFDYPAGDNLGGQTSPSALTWADVGTSTAGPYVTIQSNSLDVAGLTASFGNSIRFGGLGKSVRLSLNSPVTSSTLFYSFALKILDLTGATASGGFIAGFNNSIGTQPGQPQVVGTRVYVRTNSGGFNLGLSKNSSTSSDWVWDGTLFATNQTIFLVGSYTFTTAGDSTDDISKLWINPNPAYFGDASAPPPTLTATASSDIAANQIASFVFFQRSDVNEPAAMIADELRIATSWADVTPQPAALRIDSITMLPDGRIRLQVSGDPGQFAIESSSDLANWTELTSLVSATGIFIYTDTVSYANQRFYRARYYR